jgi:NADH:ubiquinone oxidoreductase subunit D
VQPCEQKEKIESITDKIQVMEVRQVEIQGQIVGVAKDIQHVKGRIDNGMSHTIHNLDQTLTKLEPMLNHHSEVIRRIEGMGWTLATTLLITLLGFLAWGISHGFKVKL